MRLGDFNTDDDEEEENNDDENYDFSAATPINNQSTIAIHGSCNQLEQSFTSIQMIPTFQGYSNNDDYDASA